MTDIDDLYFIHFFITARNKHKEDLHIGNPFILAFESKEEAISFLESRNYKPAPVLKNLHYNFYKPINTTHGEVHIYATISYLTTTEKLTDFINSISELLS